MGPRYYLFLRYKSGGGSVDGAKILSVFKI